MSILEEKAKVTILSARASHTVDDHPDCGILTLLQRHGMQAEYLHKKGHGQSIAQIIDNTAGDVGTKLIVMGAFEYSKFHHDLSG